MDKLAAVVALVALGGVAWMAFGQEREPGSDVSAQMEQIRADQASISERLDKLLAARQPDLMTGSDGGMVPVDVGPGLDGAGTRSGTTATDTPTSIDDRVGQLEERLRKQDEAMAALKKGGARSHMPVSFGGGKRFLRSPDDAATALKMDDAQKADMERVLENAKHELDRLYDTPNDDGQTFATLQKKMADEIKDRKADAPFTNILSHITNQQKFKQGKIPGSNETYAQAERRISKNAMGDIRRGLTPDQQKEWDNSHTGALLPGSGGTTTVSTMVVGEPSSGAVFLGGSDK